MREFERNSKKFALMKMNGISSRVVNSIFESRSLYIKTLVLLMLLSVEDIYALTSVESFLDLGYTYRKDALHWSIGDSVRGPNILSELIWRDLAINQISIAGQCLLENDVVLQGEGDYGCIFRGRNRDSDYFKDNRQSEFARSYSNAGDGEVFDFSGALGYNFSFFCKRLRLIPLLGFSWSEQHLQMYDGVYTIPFKAKIFNLHSSYQTKWYGPWIGTDFLYHFYSNFLFFSGVEFHWLEYRGVGHWNLRKDFLTDFDHFSSGIGVACQLGLSYFFSHNWSLNFSFNYRDYRADQGWHEVVIDVPEEGAVRVKADFNEAIWRSLSGTFSLTSFF